MEAACQTSGSVQAAQCVLIESLTGTELVFSGNQLGRGSRVLLAQQLHAGACAKSHQLWKKWLRFHLVSIQISLLHSPNDVKL